MYRDVIDHINQADAVLALGGDNYSLDSGLPPVHCTNLDDLVTSSNKPMIIWGASVGPFSKLPEYERYMSEHLQEIHIMAREPATVRYLAQLGLTERVYKVADPAFLMEPQEPKELDFEIAPGSIGLWIWAVF